jgi:hypothetical protein
MVVKAASLTQPRLLHPRVNTLPTARPHTFRIFTFDKAQLKSVHAAANVIVNVNLPQVHLACMRVVRTVNFGPKLRRW